MKRQILTALTKLVLIFVILAASAVHAQLPDFDLQVSKTDETCLGNGSLSFTPVNGTPQASFLYTVYKLPNLVTPVSVSGLSLLSGLNAGTYKIVAIQTLGAFSNSDEDQIVIDSSIIPLAYSVEVSNQNCSQGAQVTLVSTSGTIVQSEILSGPETRPLQNSNVFTNLPAGTYVFRAFDACGDAEPLNYTIVLTDADLTISEALFTGANTSCDITSVTNSISAAEGTSISYPLTVQYTVHSPDGSADQTFTQTITSGPASSVDAVQELPLFPVQFSYDIVVTDNCNAAFTRTGLTVAPSPVVNIQDILGSCGFKYLQIDISKYTAPVTVNFVSAPDSFNALSFNSGHPGPFTDSTILYGSADSPVPSGTYTLQITDACGRTAMDEVIVDNNVPLPVGTGRNNGCYAVIGSILVVAPGRTIVSATVLDAPDLYVPQLPHNVTQYIIDGKLKLLNVPVGTYIISVTDDCGMSTTVTVIVPPFEERDFTAVSIPYCTAGVGSVQVRSENGKLASINIVDAPSSFTESLPYNASANITPAGVFFMGDLPAGNYTFSGTDICGIQRTVSVVVTGYAPDNDAFTYVPNCGSFDIVMSDNDAVTSEPTYWLQKKHALTGAWGHPQSGTAYAEGLPTTENSVSLVNNETTYNFIYQGDFRIVKAFKSYATAAGEQYCIETWEPFTFNMDLKIANAYNLACAETPNSVYIDAVNGLAPYTYQISTKDGQPFIVNNGSNNIFSNLSGGVYNFVVTDACGYIANKLLDVSTLPALVTANLADDMLLCIEPAEGTTHTFDLSQQDEAILGGQHTDFYTITYHLSIEDADNAVNALPTTYIMNGSSQTIYARVEHNSIDVCHDVTSFQIIANQNPEFETTTKYMCEGQDVVISAPSGYDTYLWSTGETTQTIFAHNAGTYTVTVKQIFGDRYCESTTDIVVSPSGPATVLSVDTEDWTYDQNSITVNVSGNGNYEYSLDGVNYQAEPTFTNLVIGSYTVFIKDHNGCGVTEQQVLLLNYPNFFTPNGDGTHDKWRIKYSFMEPDMDIQILDRYGKQIISLDPESEGWDGTYNGAALPSTDYWFVVTRANGQVHKGHFSMKR